MVWLLAAGDKHQSHKKVSFTHTTGGTWLVRAQSHMCVHLFTQDTYEVRWSASVSYRSGPSSSPLGGSCTAHSRLRQLETISLNQQTPAYFHHTKGAICTFSTLPANSRACVCVPFKNASALSSSISWFISSTLNFFFFFPIRIFSFFFPLVLTDCSWGQD